MKRSDLPFKNARARAIVRAVAIFGLAGGCAAVALAASNRVSITRQGDTLVIQSNGIADHAVGQFPNRSNPNAISEQDYTFVVDATPSKARQVTAVERSAFGVALNGVPFDPNAAEWWQRDRNSGWSYDPFAVSGQLGMDRNNAHVQPNGAYHYHGLPTGFMGAGSASEHSALIGFAADGFPIYAQYGLIDGQIAEQQSSYQLRSGTRPSGPGGRYDGTFVEDYVYVAGVGDLDACNGEDTVTPEYPNGTYAYFLTDEFPYVPRCWVGTPSTQGFAKQGPGNARSNSARPHKANGFPPPPRPPKSKR